MNDRHGYAVYFFPQALEALGDAIKPFLANGPAGPHVACIEVDTGGAFVELTLEGQTGEGKPVSLELMVPSGMVRMIMSTQNEAAFGFGLRYAGGTAADSGDAAAATGAGPASD